MKQKKPTLNDIKEIEVISPLVSEMYAPIYSSELVQSLAPEFELIDVKRIYKANTMHYVDLKDKDNSVIRIYNSYDRRLAFRMSLVSKDNFTVDLGTDRIIHKGLNAKTLTDNLKDTKKSILKGVKNAKIVAKRLNTTKIRPRFARVVSDVVFNSLIQKEGFQGYTNYTDVIKNISVAEYINQSTKRFIEGDYTVTFSGKKRKGQKITSAFKKVEIQNKLVKIIAEEYPEYFL